MKGGEGRQLRASCGAFLSQLQSSANGRTEWAMEMELQLHWVLILENNKKVLKSTKDATKECKGQIGLSLVDGSN